MNPLEILKKKLIGNSYCHYSIDDTFKLFFYDFWLVAQNIESPDEIFLNNILVKNYQPANEAVDKEYIAKSIIICSTLRKNVIDMSISEDSVLKLTFENGVNISFLTNTDIVDWQWALNHQGEDPYTDFMIGCYSRGKIEVA